MKTFLRANVLLIAMVLFASCAPTLKVTSDYDHSAVFTNYKTFAMYPVPDKNSTISQLNQNRIVAAVKAQMVAAGYTEVSSNPDLTVNVTAYKSDQKSLVTNSDNYGYGGFYRPYGWGGGYGMGGMSTSTTTVQTTTTGSIIIDVVDAAKNLLLWTGTGNKEIDKPSSNPTQDIDAAIAKIMASFPPGATKK